MESLPYVLPWVMALITVALVVCSYLLEWKSLVGKIVTGVLALILVAVAVYANLVSMGQKAKIQEKVAELNTVEEWKYQHLDEIALLLAELKPPEENTLEMFNKLNSFGWEKENPVFQRALRADQSRENLRAEFSSQKPMLIKGIPTDVDAKLVELGLRQVGFSVIPYRDDEEPLAQANIIYYGRDIELTEVKLAALTLMRAGVGIKGIKPFPEDTQGNLRAVKFDWNKYYAKRVEMEPEAIEKADFFK